MALDLGELSVRVEAQVGDTVNRLNKVKDSLDDTASAAQEASTKLNNVNGADFSETIDSIKSMGNELKGLSGKDVAVGVDVDDSGISNLTSELDGIDVSSVIEKFTGTGGLGSAISSALSSSSGSGLINLLTGVTSGTLGGAFASFITNLRGFGTSIAKIAPFASLIAGISELVSYLWGDDFAAGFKPASQFFETELAKIKEDLSLGWAVKLQLDEDTLQNVIDEVEKSEAHLKVTATYADENATYAAQYGMSTTQVEQIRSLAEFLEVDIDEIGQVIKKMPDVWADEEKANELKNLGISSDEDYLSQISKIVAAARKIQDEQGGNAGYEYMENLLGGANAQNLMAWMQMDKATLEQIQSQLQEAGVYYDKNNEKFLTLSDLQAISEQTGIATEKLASGYYIDEAIALQKAQNASDAAYNKLLAVAGEYGLDSNEYNVAMSEYVAAEQKAAEAEAALVAKETELNESIQQVKTPLDELNDAKVELAAAQAAYEVNPNSTNKYRLEQANLAVERLEKGTQDVLTMYNTLTEEELAAKREQATSIVNTSGDADYIAQMTEFINSDIAAAMSNADWDEFIKGLQQKSYEYSTSGMVDEYGNPIGQTAEQFYGSSYVDLATLISEMTEKYSDDAQENVANIFNATAEKLTDLVPDVEASAQTQQKAAEQMNQAAHTMSEAAKTPHAVALDIIVNGDEYNKIV